MKDFWRVSAIEELVEYEAEYSQKEKSGLLLLAT
jgi:hypothetical protein